MKRSMDAIIFDWSGTISDDRRPVYEANQLMSDHYGVPRVSFEEWLPKTTMNAIQYFRTAGVEASDEDIHALYRRYFNEVNAHLLPIVYADARLALEQLAQAGFRLSVLSAHPEPNLIKEATSYGLADVFERIVGDSRDKREGIRSLLRELGMAREQTIYVGDTTHDMQAAKSAGVVAGAITTGYHTENILRDEDPDHVFHSLTHLTHILLQNGT